MSMLVELSFCNLMFTVYQDGEYEVDLLKEGGCCGVGEFFYVALFGR